MAKTALNTLHELLDINPSVARSPGGGNGGTLTVRRLHLPPQLRKTGASTTVIASAFPIVHPVCRNLKTLPERRSAERGVGPGPFLAGKQFRRIIGTNLDPDYKMEALTQSKAKAAVARKETW